jgi:RNA polymerase sigma-70 factor (ECF subfamily)
MQPEQSGSDHDAYSRLKRGDEKEWSRLYSVLKRPLYELIQGVLRNPGASEELLQEVFLGMFLSRHQLDEQRGSVLGWASMIARNKAVDYVRVRRNMISFASSDLDSVGDELPALNPERDYIHREYLRLLMRRSPEVDKNQQRVLALAYEEGLSHSEIAARLRIPLGTVKTRLRSALQSLRATQTCFS